MGWWRRLRARWQIGRAETAIHRGDPDRAAEILRGAVSVAEGQERAGVLLKLGMLAGRAGRREEAAGYLREAISIQPDAAAYLALGDVLEGADALNAYRAALEREPENPLALYRVGMSCAEAGDHAEAARHLARAVELFGENDAALFYVGMARLRLGQPAAALEAFKRFAEMSPNDPLTEFGLAYAHENLQHAELAARHYQAFLRRANGRNADFVRQAEKFLRTRGEMN